MKATILLAVGLATGVGRAWGQLPGRIDALRRPGETVLLSFKTANGKTVVLCEGAKRAYLVYRFGTATNVELQYPTLLTAASWQNFTYYPYHRSASPQAQRYFLSFSNSGTEYELSDMTEQEGDDYGRYVGVSVTLPKGKTVTVKGKQNSIQGGLALSGEQQARVKQYGDE